MYLDALESQFRGLIKAIDLVAKQRAGASSLSSVRKQGGGSPVTVDVVTAANELSQALAELAQSGLSKQLSHTIGMLGEVEGRIKDLQEGQAKDDVMTFLAGGASLHDSTSRIFSNREILVDEYTRLIGSIRLAFMSRERVFVAWQNAESDVRKVRAGHEKARRQGKLPTDPTGVTLNQLTAAERRAIDSKNEFDSVTKLVKSEIARFEHERIEDFKDSLEMFLENMIRRQREVRKSIQPYRHAANRLLTQLINAWDQYQSILLKRIGQNPPVVNGSPQSARS
jgi:sorting nexin-1/2